MPFILGTNSIKDTGFDVDNSLRFNDDDSANLSRTKGTSDSTKKGTYSFWFKPSKTAGLTLIENGTASADRAIVYIASDNTLKIFSKIGNSTKLSLATNRVFRDLSAWYNLVLAIDTTQGTASNRVKLYINGTQETSFGTETYPDQNDALRFFTSSEIEEIGIDFENGGLFDGYMCEIVKVDNAQLDATSFGEFDSDSPTIWKPIDVSGLTFGTNGYYLDFESSGSLGNDVSGNSNNFTANNFAATDQSTDTCTNNFATLNPIQAALSSATFSEGNLKSVTAGTSGENFGGGSSIGVASGKWYFEAKATVGSGSADRNVIGVTGELSTIAYNKSYYGSSSTVSYQSYNGKVIKNEVDQYTGSTYATGDIIRIALDLDNLHVYFGKGGTWQNSGNPESGSTGTGAVDLVALTSTTDGFYFVYHGDNSGASGPVSTFEFNFGSPSYSESGGETDGNGYGNFNQSVPSGYYALNTKNLAEYG